MPRKATKPPRTFADSFKRYDKPGWTYDTSNGHGNVHEWSAAWDQKMGAAEATATLNGDDPLVIFGLKALPETLDILRKTYRKLLQAIPGWQALDAPIDAQEKVKKVMAAFSQLEDRIHARKK